MPSFEFRISSFERRLAAAIFVLAALTTLPASAEWKSIGPVSGSKGSVTTLPNGAEFTAGAARVRITALKDSVIRVQVSNPSSGRIIAGQANFFPEFSWAVLTESLRWSEKVRVNQTAKAIELSTSQ